MEDKERQIPTPALSEQPESAKRKSDRNNQKNQREGGENEEEREVFCNNVAIAWEQLYLIKIRLENQMRRISTKIFHFKRK